MNVRCFYCGWNFILSPDEVADALAEAQTSHAKIHMTHCPKCRRAIKVPVQQMRRFAPTRTPAGGGETAGAHEPSRSTSESEPMESSDGESTA